MDAGRRIVTRPLTIKQAWVLEYLRQWAPLTAEQVGMAWHVRQGVHRDGDTCTFCKSDGNGVLRSVGLRPHVTRRLRPTRWELRNAPAPALRSSPVDYDPATGEGIPF